MNLDAGQAAEALPWEALAGVSRREARVEITLFKGVGMATQDLGTVILVLEAVGATRVGTPKLHTWPSTTTTTSEPARRHRVSGSKEIDYERRNHAPP